MTGRRRLPAVTRNSAPDLVTMNILDSCMVSICREMGILLMKTSYSTIFNEGLDFTCALADAKGDMIACAEFCPTMIGGMPLLIKTCAQEIDFATLEDGDVLIHNDPYRGGLHCPEHTVFKPFFVDGALLGFAVCIGHIAEIGGMVPGAFCGEATEIFHEGLRVPPVKIKKAGKDVDEVWKLLLANVRTPRQNYGDLRAMIGSVDLGVERISEQVAEVRPRDLPADLRRPEGLFRTADAGRIVGLSRRQVLVRGRDRGRRHRGQTLHRRRRHLRAGRRGGRRLRPQLAAGERPDQRHARGHDRRHLQWPAAPRRIPSIPKNSGCFRPIRVVAPPDQRDQRRLSGARWSPAIPRPIRGLACIVIGAMSACVPSGPMASEKLHRDQFRLRRPTTPTMTNTSPATTSCPAAGAAAAAMTATMPSSASTATAASIRPRCSRRAFRSGSRNAP